MSTKEKKMESGRCRQIKFEMCKTIKSRGKEIHSEGVCMLGINHVAINWCVCVCVFLFTGLGCGSGFADVLQDRVSLFILSILFFLDSTQLRRGRNLTLCLWKVQIFFFFFLKLQISICLFRFNYVGKGGDQSSRWFPQGQQTRLKTIKHVGFCSEIKSVRRETRTENSRILSENHQWYED